MPPSHETVTAYKQLRRYSYHCFRLARWAGQPGFIEVLRDYCTALNAGHAATATEAKAAREAPPFDLDAIDFTFIADRWADNLDFNNPAVRTEFGYRPFFFAGK